MTKAKVEISLKLHNLEVLKPSKKIKRLGRGTGSGHGKTASFGNKGQKSRSGHKFGANFEGGQMPFHRRIPKKRGFARFKKLVYQTVNLYQIDQKKLKIVDHKTLYHQGLIASLKLPVKILAFGALTSPVDFKVNAFSKKAVQKITSNQGKIIPIA